MEDGPTAVLVLYAAVGEVPLRPLRDAKPELEVAGELAELVTGGDGLVAGESVSNTKSSQTSNSKGSSGTAIGFRFSTGEKKMCRSKPIAQTASVISSLSYKAVHMCFDSSSDYHNIATTEIQGLSTITH